MSGSRELENDPASGCFGCGPANASGLRLAFVEDGGAVRCEHVVGAGQTGWPGRFHGGLLFTMLLETAYWTVIGAADRIGAAGAMSFDLRSLPRVGEHIEATGRVLSSSAAGWEVEAVACGAGGRALATLRSPWRPVTAEEAERLGFTPSMRDHVPPG